MIFSYATKTINFNKLLIIDAILYYSCLSFRSDARRRKPPTSYSVSRLSQQSRWPEVRALVKSKQIEFLQAIVHIAT